MNIISLLRQLLTAFFCFLVAVVFLAGSLVFYVVITKSEFYQYYLAEKLKTSDAELDKEFKNLEVPETEETEFLSKEKSEQNPGNGDGPHPPPTKIVIPHKGNVYFQSLIYTVYVREVN